MDLFKRATFSARLIFKATFLVDEGLGSEVDPTDNSIMGDGFFVRDVIGYRWMDGFGRNMQRS